MTWVRARRELVRHRQLTNFWKVSTQPFHSILDICETMDRKISESPELEAMRREKDFLYEKLRDIDHLTDIFEGKEIEVGELVAKIRTIIQMGEG